MLKIILVLLLIGYTFYKVISFVFSALFGSFVKNRSFENGQKQYKTSKKIPNSNVSIDFIPQNKSKKKSGTGKGEYIDYEEMK